MKYTLKNINITFEPLDNDYPPFVMEQVASFYHKLQRKKMDYSVVEGLKKNIAKFPDVPEFKNYLAAAYDKMNKHEQRDTVLIQMLQEHPDYVFGVLQNAEFFLQNDELAKAQEIYNDSESISELFPKRKIFHVNEIIAYYSVLTKIKTMEENWGDAGAIINMLESEIDGVDDEVSDLRNFLMLQKLKSSINDDLDVDDWDDLLDFDEGIEPQVIKELPETTDSLPPDFVNPFVHELYEQDDVVSSELAQKILSSDRTTIIQDLVKVLEDTEKRMDVFFENIDGDEDLIFINTLILLKELKAEEALEDVLERFRNNGEYFEFWAENEMRFLWMVIFELGKNKIQVLADFLKEPGVFSWFKNSVSEALSQLYQHYPEKRLQIKLVWKDLLQLMVDATPEDNIISSVFIASLIGDIYDAKSEDYLPLIEELYDNDRVDLILFGDYISFLEDYENPVEENVLSLEEIQEIGFR